MGSLTDAAAARLPGTGSAKARIRQISPDAYRHVHGGNDLFPLRGASAAVHLNVERSGLLCWCAPLRLTSIRPDDPCGHSLPQTFSP